MQVLSQTGMTVEIESNSGSEYEVDMEEESCSCPDHQFRHRTCKHMEWVSENVALGESELTMTEFTCKVHYDDDKSALIKVYAADGEMTDYKGITRTARAKAEQMGRRFREGGSSSTRPQPTWAEIESEREVEISEMN